MGSDQMKARDKRSNPIVVRDVVAKARLSLADSFLVVFPPFSNRRLIHASSV
jgi:hypothetical protein